MKYEQDNQMNVNLDKKTDSKSEFKENFIKELFEYLKMIAFVVITVFVVNQFILINARIPSESMANTILAGDQIFGNRLAYLFDEPERYDIVIFKYPDDKEQYFIKRVIGLPGDTVNIIDGDVYVTTADGEELFVEDHFLPEEPYGSYGPYTVPDGSYFMLGDNRNCSKDSRFWNNTYVPEGDILGKAVLRYWPLNKFGIVK